MKFTEIMEILKKKIESL